LFLFFYVFSQYLLPGTTGVDASDYFRTYGRRLSRIGRFVLRCIPYATYSLFFPSLPCLHFAHADLHAYAFLPFGTARDTDGSAAWAGGRCMPCCAACARFVVAVTPSSLSQCPRTASPAGSSLPPSWRTCERRIAVGMRRACGTSWPACVPTWRRVRRRRFSAERLLYLP